MRSRMLLIAGIIATAALAVHLAHYHHFVSVLSGTLPQGAPSFEAAAVRAGIFVVVHFAWKLLVPSLLLASLFDWMAERALTQK
jgi:hypothetical protein